MVRVLSDADVAAVLDLSDLLPVVQRAFESQGRGAVERPERPHFPVGIDLAGSPPDGWGTGLVMPAYIHGADHFATKIATVHPENPERGLPTVNAQIVLNEAATGLPAALLAGNRVTNARTACIGGLAARELAVEGPLRLGIIGAGTQARWQTRAIDAATGVDRIRVYSPSDSRLACAEDLAAELEVPATPVDSPAAAVAEATVVVTATTSDEPVFPAEALSAGTLVIGVGAYSGDQQEVPAGALTRAARVFGDVPSEVATIGDVVQAGLTQADLVPLADVFAGVAGRESDEEILVVESVGSAVLDAAAGEYVLGAAEAADVGTTVDL